MVDEDVVQVSGAPTPYVGQDRRRLVPTVDRAGGRPFVRTGALLILAWLVLASATALPGIEQASALDLAALGRTVDAGSMAVALVAATLTVVHWRLTGDARALWVGVGFALISIASVAVSELLPLLGFRQIELELLVWIRPASLVVVLAVLVQALRTAQVDRRIHPTLLYVAAFASVGAIALLFGAVEPLGSLWELQSAQTPSGDENLWVPAVSAVAWMSLAVAYCHFGFRRGRQLLTYGGLLLFGFALADLARMLSIPFDDASWLAVSSFMRLAGVVVGFGGILAELRTVFARLSNRLFEVNVQHQTSEARHRAEQEVARERAHEARNALTAIEGATKTLQRYRDRLDPEDQSMLAAAVSTEIGRLQSLVSGGEGELAETVPFRLSDVVSSQVALARSRGLTVLCEGQTDLQVLGRPSETAEALQNLLTNAERHAPGSPVSVRVRRERGNVTVRVEDRGPGVRSSARDTMFDRGVRASAAEGSGLGLFVSRQLMTDQGGDLWYEDPPGGGACFALRLPVAVPDNGDAARDRVSSKRSVPAS